MDNGSHDSETEREQWVEVAAVVDVVVAVVQVDVLLEAPQIR